MGLDTMIRNKRERFASAVRRITAVKPPQGVKLCALVYDFAKAERNDSAEILGLIRDLGYRASIVVSREDVKKRDLLIKSLVQAGFELVNGTELGKKFNDSKQDMAKLHNEVYSKYGYDMKLGRIHGKERSENGLTVFDAYDFLEYNYLEGTFELRNSSELPSLLSKAKRKDGLNGCILDIQNMTQEELKALICGKRDNEKTGFCTVSELLSVAPFADAGPGDPGFDSAVALIDLDYPVVYRNNSLFGKRSAVFGELTLALMPRELRLEKSAIMLDPKRLREALGAGAPYALSRKWAKRNHVKAAEDFPVTNAIMFKVFRIIDMDVTFQGKRLEFKRWEYLDFLARHLVPQAGQDSSATEEDTSSK